MPDDRFRDLSKLAQKIVRFGGSEPLFGTVSPIAMIPDSWDPVYKTLFFALSEAERNELCGFLTVIIHECQHHFDLLRTPFGLSLHEKLAREYLAFERWVPTLLEHPEIFNGRFADWVLSLPPGEDVSAQLAGGSPLDQAMFDLRGPIAFDEVWLGAPPRNVTDGWGMPIGDIVIRGQAWKPVTVNRLWLTARTPWKHGYLGPSEVLEGRTLAMCLLYLIYLLGPGDETLKVLKAYCDAYYKGATTYTGLIEMQAGMPLKDLLARDIATITLVLHEVMIASWFALHAPVSVNDADVQHGVATKYLLAGRFLAAQGWGGHKDVADLLDFMDREFAPLGAIPVREGLARAAGRSEGTRDRIKDVADAEMRAWYDGLLAVIGRDMVRRLEGGYLCRSGTPEDGNALRAARFDEGANEVMELDPAGARILEWYQLRGSIIYVYGPMAEKTSVLRAFFDLP